jgi:ribosome assembly protein 4
LQDDPHPYSFYVHDQELVQSIEKDILSTSTTGSDPSSTEDLMIIKYRPQAVFRVRAVTRCSSTLTGSQFIHVPGHLITFGY